MGAFLALVMTCVMTAIVAPAAFSQSKSEREQLKTLREATRFGAVSDDRQRTRAKLPPAFRSSQDGPMFGHLPPVQQNLELVGELNLLSPSSGQPVEPGQIADVAVHKGYAYLNSWDSPTCRDGGTFVVDIRNPAAPRQVSFIPAPPNYYHGEGAQVVSIDTPQFKGDVLAVNDETYGSNLAAPCSPPDKRRGGFDLYNVTNPAVPVPLVQGAGDRSPESSETQNPLSTVSNAYHSVFVWQDGPRAYLVASDNVEFSDVDIFDITDPTNPEFVKDLDVLELPEAEQIVSESARGNLILHHDVVVKRIAGQMRMLVSYWDAGYVQLNVNNPASPTHITDTNFDDPDPLTGLDPPEGNAHQAEYSHDNQFFLAADEDFAPFRPTSKITEAPYADRRFVSALSAAEPIEPGAPVAGDTVYVGQACAGTVSPPPAGVTIAVAERGTCSFQEKADAIEAAGYDMGVIFNNDFGAGGGRCESLINMLIDPATVAIPMAFVGRADGLRILNSYPNNYQCTGAAAPTPGDTPAPASGTQGLRVEFATVHDGWGYAHLYDANTSEEIDAFAIPESLDARYAEGFGDLSIHEFATDPTTNLAYASYYSGGIRVFRFGRQPLGLQQTGAWIDPDGSNFWGVEQFTTSGGERLIAGSDRDFGLQILRYTGPGAVQAGAGPPAGGAQPPRPAQPSNKFTLKVGRYRKGKLPLVATVPGSGRLSAALRLQFPVGVSALYKLARKSVPVRRAGRTRLTLTLSRKGRRRVNRALAAHPRRRLIGRVTAVFQPTGGQRRGARRRITIRGG